MIIPETIMLHVIKYFVTQLMEKCSFCTFSFLQGAVIKMSNQGSSALHICIMAKEDIMQNKDSKFAAGMQVTCPYLFCNFKNSQFQSAGRFPSGLDDFLTID